MSEPKDFVSLADWSGPAIEGLLDRAAELKAAHRRGENVLSLAGKTLAMYFEKPSLRTQVTFEAGMAQLGGTAISLRPEQVGIGVRETAGDVARNLSRWVHGLVARTFSHALVEELAAAAAIPVINGLTDALHPCQALADLLTVRERVGLRDAAVAYVGDGNNVASSLLLAWSQIGGRLRLATPPDHRPPELYLQWALDRAAQSGAEIRWTEDPVLAVAGADFVYTDVWASMGQEAEAESRRRRFRPYQVNGELLAHAPGARVMHCLPAHRGEEITAGVIDGPQSIVFDQAENRLHAQKAILERLLAAPHGVFA